MLKLVDHAVTSNEYEYTDPHALCARLLGYAHGPPTRDATRSGCRFTLYVCSCYSCATHTLMPYVPQSTLPVYQYSCSSTVLIPVLSYTQLQTPGTTY